jgi:hypothetical protein
MALFGGNSPQSNPGSKQGIAESPARRQSSRILIAQKYLDYDDEN